MEQGHKQAQKLFLQLGVQQGFDVAKQWSKTLPTDGVWLARETNLWKGQLPYAAIEVLGSEKGKVVMGSIATLERVSPCVGILLLQDLQIERRCYRAGMSESETDEKVKREFDRVKSLTVGSTQRLVVWKTSALVHRVQEQGEFINV